MAQLRQQEADLKACHTRLKFYEEKSQWLQKRVNEGFGNVDALWTMGQKLTEERATEVRLKILIASLQYQLASYAGKQTPQLLSYLQGQHKRH